MSRAKDPKPADIDKFMKLEDDKRNRIINAAMKEFRYGFKKASTDVIVKEAGISKGLLFHYFVTKEQLYIFLMSHASDLVQKNYFDMMNMGNQDILDAFWQIGLLMKDISEQYPYLHDFLKGLEIHISDFPNVEEVMLMEKEQEKVYEELFYNCNIGLFRDDIDPRKACDIIAWTLDSYINDGEKRAIDAGGWNDENYESFLEGLKDYVSIFRTTFYK